MSNKIVVFQVFILFFSRLILLSPAETIKAIAHNSSVGTTGWCPLAREECERNSGDMAQHRCDVKILLLVLSPKSNAYHILTESINLKGDAIVMTNSSLIESCVNVSSSVENFKSYTGDPFTHNPFEPLDINQAIQKMCLKAIYSLNEGIKPNTNFISFVYGMENVKNLLNVFPCTRAVVSKRFSHSKHFRSISKRIAVMRLAPQHPKNQEISSVLRWLGLQTSAREVPPFI